LSSEEIFVRICFLIVCVGVACSEPKIKCSICLLYNKLKLKISPFCPCALWGVNISSNLNRKHFSALQDLNFVFPIYIYIYIYKDFGTS
jgi:hypothetical protein